MDVDRLFSAGVTVGADDKLVWLRDAVLHSAGFAIFNTSDEEVGTSQSTWM